MIKYNNLNLKNINSVFFQGFGSPKVSEIITNEIVQNYIKSESEEYILSLFNLMNVYWINNPNSSLLAENKPRQLRIATELEMNIPNSLLTNDPQEVRKFYDKHKMMIIKPLKINLIHEENEKKVMFTRLISDDETAFENVRYSPCFFQEYINKSLELRVFVIHDKVFSVAIYSQETEMSKIDWRRASVNLKIEEYHLREDIAEKCIQLTKKLGLEYGAIDMIIDKDENHYFLEINPTGEWAWFEIKSGVKIRKALINRLTK